VQRIFARDDALRSRLPSPRCKAAIARQKPEVPGASSVDAKSPCRHCQSPPDCRHSFQNRSRESRFPLSPSNLWSGNSYNAGRRGGPSHNLTLPPRVPNDMPKIALPCRSLILNCKSTRALANSTMLAPVGSCGQWQDAAAPLPCPIINGKCPTASQLAIQFFLYFLLKLAFVRDCAGSSSVDFGFNVRPAPSGKSMSYRQPLPIKFRFHLRLGRQFFDFI
jgi:hypothetical protein